VAVAFSVPKPVPVLFSASAASAALFFTESHCFLKQNQLFWDKNTLKRLEMTLVDQKMDKNNP